MSVLPSYLVQDRVESGRMARLWSPARAVQNEIWLVYRMTDRHDAVISRFVRHLSTGLGGDSG